MVQAIRKIPISQIILDEKIYPRSGRYPKRVSMFAENIHEWLYVFMHHLMNLAFNKINRL